MRGFRTALIEARDLASGTSSLSSRLIHGGLRYLEQGHFRLVHEATRERRTLLRIAPHLVRPLAFVFPVHQGDRVPLWKLAAGMMLYDLLAPLRNVRRHRILTARCSEEPYSRTGLVREPGTDAQCDDARLVVATVRSAMLAAPTSRRDPGHRPQRSGAGCAAPCRGRRCGRDRCGRRWS
jgi:glycerol-3-phosphate dehydrogenase